MSKTFKSAVSHREVRVWPADAGFAIAVLDDVSNKSTSTQLAPSDAPALALAILEAAGVKACAKEFGATAGTMAQLEDIAWALADYSNAKALEAEQAADREALEGEAWELYKANKPDTPCTGFEPGHHAHTVWLRVARKARELHGATK